jgi:hypothetical protein
MVLLVLLFAGFIRVRLLAMPLERDEGEYAYAGQLILQGVPPYELAYNMKLPGTYFVCALGMAVFGQTISGIHLTLLLANSLTIVFVFLLGRKLFGNLAGVVAGASYAVMALSPAVAGLAAHANHFVVLFAVPGTLLLLKANETGGLKFFFWSGLLLGLAFLMKQQGIGFSFFGLFFLIWVAVRNREFLSKQFGGKILAFGTGLVLPYGLTCLWFAVAGVFDRFWFWTVVYARIYESAMPAEIGIRGCLAGHLRQTRDLSAGFWALTLAGLLAACFQRVFRKPMRFTVMFWLFSFLGTAAGLYFRGQYFILLLPAFALLVGMAVAALQSSWRFQKFAGDRFRPGAGVDDFLPGPAFFPVVGHAGLPESLPAESICRGGYRGESAAEKFRRQCAGGGHGIGAGNLFLRAPPFGDRLHLHLRVDGVATARARNAAGNGAGDRNQPPGISRAGAASTVVAAGTRLAALPRRLVRTIRPRTLRKNWPGWF